MGEILEVGSRKHQRQRKHLTWVGQNARRCTEEKYDFKMRHLKRKHITELRNENKKDYVTKWREKHHNLQIYRELDGKEPEVIPQEEVLQIGHFPLNKKEKTFLRYFPKATIERKFDLKVFNNDCQQMGCKIRWEEQRINQYMEEKASLPDERITKYEDLEDEEKENLVLEEEKDKKIYVREEGTLIMAKARITESRLNAHIMLPPSQPLEKEAQINLRIGRSNQIAKDFYHQETREGKQRPNMDREEMEGKISIEKRLKAEEIIMLQSDKSGKLIPTKRDLIAKLGEEHTMKDREKTKKEDFNPHEEQDHHTSQLIMCFNIILEKVQRHQGNKGCNASVLSCEDFLRRVEIINRTYQNSEQDISMGATDVNALFPA